MRRCLGCALWLVALFAGCIDPKGEFDAFGKRLEEKQRAEMEAELHEAEGGAQGGDCVATPEALAGEYYFTMRPSVAADALTPLILTLEPSGENELSVSLQPVMVKDKKTPSGPPSKGKMTLEGNTFSTPAFDVKIPGDADYVVEDTDLVVNIVLTGRVCRDGEPISFLCGDLDGKVTVPVELSLAGSSFGAHRYDGDVLPPLAPSCKEREGPE